MKTQYKKISIAALLLMVSGVTYAHPGHSELTGFISGVFHPLLGFDHLLAMLAVGIWAAQIGARAVWSVPVTFVVVMIVGAVLGISGITLPNPEHGIALSVLLLGLLSAFALKLPTALSMLIVAIFALFHGYAHGTEMPQAASAALYALGFILATASLHVMGVFLGSSKRFSGWVRMAGGAIAMVGSFLVFNAATVM